MKTKKLKLNILLFIFLLPFLCSCAFLDNFFNKKEVILLDTENAFSEEQKPLTKIKEKAKVLSEDEDICDVYISIDNVIIIPKKEGVTKIKIIYSKEIIEIPISIKPRKKYTYYFNLTLTNEFDDDIYILTSINNFKEDPNWKLKKDGKNYFLEISLNEDILEYKYSVFDTNLTNNRTAKIKKDDNIIINDKIDNPKNIKPKPKAGEVVLSKDEYYKNVTKTSGYEMFSQIKETISNINTPSYGEARFILMESDVYLQNREYLWTIYDGRTDHPVKWNGSVINREHVWPNSRLGRDRVKHHERDLASDCHNLRAIYAGINRTRSNYYFVEGKGKARILGDRKWYPGDEHKGDCARILFYMAVMYSDILELIDDDNFLLQPKSYNPEGAKMGKLSILLKWHLEDPVDDFEVNRNNVIAKHQKNRNPFIDNPSWFEPIWKYFMEKQNLQISIYKSRYYVLEAYKIIVITYKKDSNNFNELYI